MGLVLSMAVMWEANGISDRAWSVAEVAREVELADTQWEGKSYWHREGLEVPNQPQDYVLPDESQQYFYE